MCVSYRHTLLMEESHNISYWMTIMKSCTIWTNIILLLGQHRTWSFKMCRGLLVRKITLCNCVHFNHSFNRISLKKDFHLIFILMIIFQRTYLFFDVEQSSKNKRNFTLSFFFQQFCSEQWRSVYSWWNPGRARTMWGIVLGIPDAR